MLLLASTMALIVEPRVLRNRFLRWVKVDVKGKLTGEAREKRLRKHFGQDALTLATQWFDLCHRDEDLKDIKLTEKEKKQGLKMFAAAHYFLWHYPRNAVVLGDIFDMCEKYASGEHLWIWIRRIAKLEERVIFFPDDLKLVDSEIMALSIDGVDKKTWERKHETLPYDRKNCTHKHNHGGLKYQITLCAQRKQCVNIYGPVRGGMGDKDMLERSGVLDLLRLGKLACCDRGYIAKKFMKKVSWPNPHDSKETSNFKSHIRLRHETFNGRMSYYAAMNETWEHSIEQHGWAFRAIAVTIQYSLNNGASTLFQP